MKPIYSESKEEYMRTVFVKCIILGLFNLSTIDATEITTAIDSGYIHQVESILQRNPDLLNMKDDDALTPLNRASYKGQAEIVKLIDAVIIFYLFPQIRCCQISFGPERRSEYSGK